MLVPRPTITRSAKVKPEPKVEQPKTKQSKAAPPHDQVGGAADLELPQAEKLASGAKSVLTPSPVVVAPPGDLDEPLMESAQAQQKNKVLAAVTKAADKLLDVVRKPNQFLPLDEPPDMGYVQMHENKMPMANPAAYANLGTNVVAQPKALTAPLYPKLNNEPLQQPVLVQGMRVPSTPVMDIKEPSAPEAPLNLALVAPQTPRHAVEPLYPDMREASIPYARMRDEPDPLTIHLPEAPKATLRELVQSPDSRQRYPVLDNFKVDASGIRLNQFTTISPHNAAVLIRDVLALHSLDADGKLQLLMATNKGIPLLQAAVTHKVSNWKTFQDIIACVEQIASSDLPIEAKEALMKSINAKAIMAKSGQGVASIAKTVGVLMSLPKGHIADRERLLKALGLDKEELIARLKYASTDGRQTMAIQVLRDAYKGHPELDGSGLVGYVWRSSEDRYDAVVPVRMVLEERWDLPPTFRQSEFPPIRLRMLCLADPEVAVRLDQELVHPDDFGVPPKGQRYVATNTTAFRFRGKPKSTEQRRSDRILGRREYLGIRDKANAQPLHAKRLQELKNERRQASLALAAEVDKHLAKGHRGVSKKLLTLLDEWSETVKKAVPGHPSRNTEDLDRLLEEFGGSSDSDRRDALAEYAHGDPQKVLELIETAKESIYTRTGQLLLHPETAMFDSFTDSFTDDWQRNQIFVDRFQLNDVRRERPLTERQQASLHKLLDDDHVAWRRHSYYYQGLDSTQQP